MDKQVATLIYAQERVFHIHVIYPKNSVYRIQIALKPLHCDMPGIYHPDCDLDITIVT